MVRRRKREGRTGRNKSAAGGKVKKVQEGRKSQMPVRRNVSNKKRPKNEGAEQEKSLMSTIDGAKNAFWSY